MKLNKTIIQLTLVGYAVMMGSLEALHFQRMFVEQLCNTFFN